MLYGANPLASVSCSTNKRTPTSAVVVAATTARPSSDVSVGGWLPSIGAKLYSVINEVVPDSAYIYTSTLTTCEITLNATTAPGNILSYKATSSLGNGLFITLLSGGDQIASWSHALTKTDDLYTHTLTAAQSAAMAGGNVTVQITAT